MKSTVITFLNQETGRFKQISEPVASQVEEAIIRACEECLREQLEASDIATCAMPWGVYTATSRDGENGGNINISFEVNPDFQEAVDDEKGQKAMYLDEFTENYQKHLSEFAQYGEFNVNDKKPSAVVNKGVKLSEFLLEYFPNSYGMMLLNAAREHKADGEIYQIKICDTVAHGVLEFEYTGDKTKISFTPDKAFKQYLKNDKVSDAE